MKLAVKDVEALRDLWPITERMGNWSLLYLGGVTYKLVQGSRGITFAFDSPRGIEVECAMSSDLAERAVMAYLKTPCTFTVSLQNAVVVFTGSDTAKIGAVWMRWAIETAIKDLQAELASRIKERKAAAKRAEAAAKKS